MIQMKRALINYAIPLMACVVFVGCFNNARRDLVEQQAEKYYKFLDEEKVDSVLTLFSPIFYAITPKEKFADILRERVKFGKTLSRSLVNKEEEVRIENTKKIILVTLKYKVAYKDGVILERLSVRSIEPFSPMLTGMHAEKVEE